MADFFNSVETMPRDYPVIGLLSPDKLLSISLFAGLSTNSRVIDFGCGFGESLRHLVERLGVSGVGIDLLGKHIEQAKKSLEGHPAAGRIEFVQADATKYPFAPESYDMAMNINASNMFGASDVMFRNAIIYMKRAVKKGGCLLIAEPCYNSGGVPTELVEYEGPLPSESGLLKIVREENLEVISMIHSDVTDWDRYISTNSYDTVRWLRANKNHPEWEHALASHREFQDMYVGYRMQYQESVALLMAEM